MAPLRDFFQLRDNCKEITPKVLLSEKLAGAPSFDGNELSFAEEIATLSMNIITLLLICKVWEISFSYHILRNVCHISYFWMHLIFFKVVELVHLQFCGDGIQFDAKKMEKLQHSSCCRIKSLPRNVPALFHEKIYWNRKHLLCYTQMHWNDSTFCTKISFFTPCKSQAAFYCFHGKFWYWWRTKECVRLRSVVKWWD